MSCEGVEIRSVKTKGLWKAKEEGGAALFRDESEHEREAKACMPLTPAQTRDIRYANHACLWVLQLSCHRCRDVLTPPPSSAQHVGIYNGTYSLRGINPLWSKDVEGRRNKWADSVKY